MSGFIYRAACSDGNQRLVDQIQDRLDVDRFRQVGLRAQRQEIADVAMVRVATEDRDRKIPGLRIGQELPATSIRWSLPLLALTKAQRSLLLCDSGPQFICGISVEVALELDQLRQVVLVVPIAAQRDVGRSLP